MTDPYVSPKGETPIQRRERLLNLTNPDWIAPPPNPDPDELQSEEPAPVPAVKPETVSKAKG